MYRSYTQLSTYEECPEAYRLKYIERIPESPTVWHVGGTAFHQVAEWYLAGELLSPRDVATAWNDAWDTAFVKQRERYPDINPSDWRAAKKGAETAEWWQVNGWRMVQDFVEWKESYGAKLVPFSDDEHTYLEHEFLVQLGSVDVKLIPDALVIDEHGQLDILDYKTGRPPKEGTQLGVYRAGVLAGLGLDATWGLFYMARDQALITVDLRKYEPNDIGERFFRLDTLIGLEDFEPKPGPACKFCPFKAKHCRFYNSEDF